MCILKRFADIVLERRPRLRIWARRGTSDPLPEPFSAEDPHIWLERIGRTALRAGNEIGSAHIGGTGIPSASAPPASLESEAKAGATTRRAPLAATSTIVRDSNPLRQRHVALLCRVPHACDLGRQ